jgi:hypothetical protein
MSAFPSHLLSHAQHQGVDAVGEEQAAPAPGLNAPVAAWLLLAAGDTAAAVREAKAAAD